MVECNHARHKVDWRHLFRLCKKAFDFVSHTMNYGTNSTLTTAFLGNFALGFQPGFLFLTSLGVLSLHQNLLWAKNKRHDSYPENHPWKYYPPNKSSPYKMAWIQPCFSLFCFTSIYQRLGRPLATWLSFYALCRRSQTFFHVVFLNLIIIIVLSRVSL